MLVKHISPILLNKLLKSSQEMRTLLTYLKTIWCLCNGHSNALASRSAIQVQINICTLPDNSSDNWLEFRYKY